MTASRVVVVRDAGNLLKADVDAVARWLEDPLDTTVLVFVAGGGSTTSLEKVLKAAGAEVRAPRHESTHDVLVDAAHDAGVLLTKDAAARIESHLADDAGRAVALVDILASAAERGTALGVDDVEPYLGAEGGVPMYMLTRQIESGDVAAALEVLHRLLTVTSAQQPRPMHPLQVMGLLTNHYRRVMRVDDPLIRTNDEAASAIGGRTSPAQAGFARRAARALGTDGLREAFDALAQADLDLKGARGIPQDAVVEVLVARLARLSARTGVGPGSSRRGADRGGGRRGR
jgi:DNA polymerase-3 subunit delta